MRIYTKVVYEWRGDELVQVEAESYDHQGPVALAKGGSSAPENYENLEKLYGIQADQAEFLGKTFKDTVAPAYKGWLGEAQDYGSKANQEQAATSAGKDVAGAVSGQQQALQADLASYGINPADSRYAQGMREMGIQGAGQQAAAETAARTGVQDKGFARMQDAIGMGMGTPTQASQAANSAANSASASLTAQNQAQQNQANSVGNITRAGLNIWGAYNNAGGGGYADGGPVKRGILRLKNGGYVQRLAMGGFAGAGGGGFMGSGGGATPPPASRPPPPPTGAQQAGSAATSGQGMRAIQTGIGKAAEAGGQATNSPGVQAFGRGLQLSPADARAGQVGYKEAQEAITKKAAEAAVDKQMGITNLPQGGAGAYDATGSAGAGLNTASDVAAGEGAGAFDAAGSVGAGLGTAGDTAATAAEAAAAESAAAEAAATAAAGETAALSGAGMGAAAAVGTAVPAIGAGLALYGIGNAAGWWADGGPVTDQRMSFKGAAVPDYHMPQNSDDIVRGLVPGYDMPKFGRQEGWWADGGDVTPGSRDQTGEVDGPGGPKDDEVMAALSDGEFVMPVGAVRYFGIDKMEKMRQKGLEHERSIGISR